MTSKKLTKRELLFIILAAIFALSTIVLSVFLCIRKENGADLTYYEQKCNAFQLENANLTHGQIVFIGDSITDGCALDNFYGDLPFATYNRGIGGDNTQGVLNRLKISLFDIKPSKIVLMIGINDINGNKSKTEILNNYEKILQEISINLPNAEVFCISLLPLNKTLETFTNVDVAKSTSLILEINPAIQALASQFHYTFVNLFPDFADENNLLIANLSVDGIHLNSNGYTVYSNKLKPLLK